MTPERFRRVLGTRVLQAIATGELRFPGATLRAAREEAGHTQQQLAELVGVRSGVSVCRWETEAAQPSARCKLELLRHLPALVRLVQR